MKFYCCSWKVKELWIFRWNMYYMWVIFNPRHTAEVELPASIQRGVHHGVFTFLHSQVFRCAVSSADTLFNYNVCFFSHSSQPTVCTVYWQDHNRYYWWQTGVCVCVCVCVCEYYRGVKNGHCCLQQNVLSCVIFTLVITFMMAAVVPFF